MVTYLQLVRFHILRKRPNKPHLGQVTSWKQLQLTHEGLHNKSSSSFSWNSQKTRFYWTIEAGVEWIFKKSFIFRQISVTRQLDQIVLKISHKIRLKSFNGKKRGIIKSHTTKALKPWGREKLYLAGVKSCQKTGKNSTKLSIIVAQPCTKLISKCFRFKHNENNVYHLAWLSQCFKYVGQW